MYRPPQSSENFQNPPQYVMCPPPPPTSENSQNPPQYIMYPPPPHMWYMHLSSNVEPPTSGSSQNPQIYSQPSTPTNSNTCYRPSLSNIVLPSNKIESPVGVDEVDQTSKQYWERIKNAYNNDNVRQSGQFCERSWTQLKSRWNRIHPPVQKFNGCYKQADKHRRNGSSEKDVLADAHMIYSQDTDQPKFDAEFMSKYSKRTKVSTSGNYSSSSNPETPIEVKEYDTLSPMSRPIGPKAAKRKSKGKECPNTLDLSGIECVIKDKNMNTSKLIQLKEAQEKRLQEQERRMEYEILMKDTSNMSEQQRKDHEKFCDHIRKKLGY
ncbi:Glutathione S-transferase T2 [Glycine max]|nr:Glutathione S-transferase T2 [Glycine max]